jgi:hypothetical protein
MPLLEHLLYDVRYALRQLRKSPGFTLTAVLTLALGFVETTAIFTLVQQVMLQSLPVARPDQLWRIGDQPHCCDWGGYSQDSDGESGNWSLFSWEAYKLFRANTPGFQDLAALQADAHQALRAIYKWLNFKCHCVVDADLKSYFDTIPHDKLLLSVRSKVIDRSVVKLIAMWLKAGVMEEMGVQTEATGTPQGGVISPLLANLYLHWLDQTWEKKDFGGRQHDAHIVRSADNFVILCKERPEFYLAQAKQVLERLGLTLNAKKTRVLNATEEPFDSLGTGSR